MQICRVDHKDEWKQDGEESGEKRDPGIENINRHDYIGLSASSNSTLMVYGSMSIVIGRVIYKELD
jgi:hypothetical protein